MWHTIQTFVEGLGDVTGEEELFSRLETVAAELGFAHWAFGSLWGDPDAIQGHPPPAVRLNYPQAWIDHYFEQGYDKIDPVVLVAPYAQTSVTWDELRPYRPEFFDDAAAHGLAAGITVPLRALQGCYVLCLASTEPMTFSHPMRARLELFAHGFFAAYLRLRKLSKVDHGMTDNTVEVIRLSMAGLSVAEIAERLGISTHGVYWCAKDARKKLKCATMPQVCMKAIQQGIVAI